MRRDPDSLVPGAPAHDQVDGDGGPSGETVSREPVRSESEEASTATREPILSPYQAAEIGKDKVWTWAAGFLFFVLASAALGGFLLRVPYVALVPGSARDTEPLLEISGADEFPSDGELLFTTVRVRQRPNLWEYLWLQADDDAEIVPEQVVLQDRTPEENREFNLELMNDSKRVAVAVALEQLGYDAVQTDAVVIQQLVPGAPAEQNLTLGDSILAIDGEPTLATTELVDILSGRLPGDEILLTVQGFGEDGSREVAVVLGENEEIPGRAFLGIQPADRLRFQNDFGFVVDIDSGSVGGPSAGLAFTLAILDQLTEGELTGGNQIAVTGTVDATGEVGPVGGVLQKTAAVRDLKADVFIVPAKLGEAELELIEAKAGDDLQIVAVDTVDEALEALADLGGEVDALDEYAAVNAP